MRKVLLAAGFLCVIATLAVIFRDTVDLDSLIEREQELRETVDNRPVLAWLAGLGIYCAVSLIPGTSGKAIIFGWIFGFWAGVLLVDLALTCAALVTFWMSRLVLRDVVERKGRAVVRRINESLEEHGGWYLLMLRFWHVPYTLVNYASGASRVPTRTFAWTTSLGLLPGTMIFVYAGSRLPTLAELADGNISDWLSPDLILALVLLAVFPPVLRWVVRWLGNRTNGGAESEQPSTTSDPEYEHVRCTSS